MDGLTFMEVIPGTVHMMGQTLPGDMLVNVHWYYFMLILDVVFDESADTVVFTQMSPRGVINRLVGKSSAPRLIQLVRAGETV